MREEERRERDQAITQEQRKQSIGLVHTSPCLSTRPTSSPSTPELPGGVVDESITALEERSELPVDGAAKPDMSNRPLVLVDMDDDPSPRHDRKYLPEARVPSQEASRQPSRYSAARTAAAVSGSHEGIYRRPGSLFLAEIEPRTKDAAATRHSLPQKEGARRRWSLPSPGTLLVLTANLSRFASTANLHGADWRRSRTLIDQARKRCRIGAAVFGLLGAVAAVVQDELIVRSHDPTSATMNLLKASNSLCTLAVLICLARNYNLMESSVRLKMHLVALHPLDVRVGPSTAFRMGGFWAEAVVCGVHCIPFLTFELVQINWINIIMYRAETIGAVLNSFRIYLLWPVVRDLVLESLPRRHTISAFTKVQMGSGFALKVILNDEVMSMVFIATCWSLCFLLTGYWFRAAEFSACLLPTATRVECDDRHAKFWRLESDIAAEFQKSNDPYLWNAMWGMFTTSTTVGYGDILSTTHPGRVVALIAAMTGMVGASSLTAALATVLHWTDDERTANLVIGRQRARHQMRHHAVRIIQRFFREKKKRARGDQPANSLDKFRELRASWDARQAFREARGETSLDLDDCQSEQKRFDNFFKHVRYIQEAVKEMEEKMVSNLTNSTSNDVQDYEGITRAPSGNAKPNLMVDIESSILQRAQASLLKRRSLKQMGSSSELTARGARMSVDENRYTPTPSAHPAWLEKFGPDGSKVYVNIASGVSQTVKPSALAFAEEEEERHREDERAKAHLREDARQTVAKKMPNAPSSIVGGSSPLPSGGSHKQSYKTLNAIGKQSSQGSFRHRGSVKNLNALHRGSLKNFNALHRKSLKNLHALQGLNDASHNASKRSIHSTGSAGKHNSRANDFIESFSIIRVQSAIEQTVTAQNIARLQSMVRRNSLREIITHEEERENEFEESEKNFENEELLHQKFSNVAPDWRRQRSKVSRRLFYNEIFSATLAILGTMCAIGQNEYVLRNNDPLSIRCSMLKLANSFVSIVLVLAFYQHYWLKIVIDRLLRHLKYGQDFDPGVPMLSILSERLFWVEVLVSCTHLPPWSTGETSIEMMNNVVVYRFEMIFCCWNLLRVYLLWRPFRTWMTSDISNKHNIAAALNLHLESLFVIKRIVNSWNALLYLAFFWMLAIVAFGYVYRCTEATACAFKYTVHADCLLPNAQYWVIYGTKFDKSNDLFVWNAMWLTFVTMTSVGYGDHIPTTHGGRLVQAAATINGIILASLITACLGNQFLFSHNEHGALMVIQREKSRIKLLRAAAQILILWWRRIKGTLSAQQKHRDKFVLRRQFLEAKMETLQEIEDLEGIGSRVKRVGDRIKAIEDTLEQMAEKIWDHEEAEEHEEKWAELALH